jgi:deoxycytidine triphosphate deaminase
MLARVSLLNREQILERLKRKEIFISGWGPEQVRPAGYDLRVATEVRAFNNTIFNEGHHYGETLKLEPGDTAYVLSFESFCMPWDLAANLGIRFRFARRGLSVLTGLLVDPGFGMKLNEGEWQPVGAPLHFFVMNIGADTIPIVLGRDGDAVLSLQFLETAEPEEKLETTVPGDVKPSSALWAFHSMRALRTQVKEGEEDTGKQFAELKTRIESLDAVMETTTSATQNIVVFGVFLLAATLIGVSATILIQTLASSNTALIVDNLNRIDPSGFDATLVALAMILAIGLCLVGLVLAFTRGFAWAFDKYGPSGRARG